MILVNSDLVHKTDLLPVRHLIFEDHKDFDRITEHYPLLGYLSLNYPDGSKFLDIGTRRGASAIAMSLNPKVQVDSYDIHDFGCGNRIKAENISFHIDNILNDLKRVLQYGLILIDIDPHGGGEEERLVNFLKDNDWKGVLVIDDIGGSWKHMRKMWEEIDLIKYNVTAFGHASGTGIIDYGDNIKVEL